MSANTAVGEWVPVKDAAERLGLTVDQARRRLRSGQLRGRQVAVAQGHVWEVWLPDDTPDPRGAGGPDLDTHDQAEGEPPGDAVNGSLNGVVHAASDVVHQTPDGPPDQPGSELIASQRAREMAEYSAALLEPWRRQAAEQAERIGRLEERAEHLQAELERRDVELGQVRAQLDEATAPKEPEPVPAPEGAPRSWWQRLLWG